jgi:predicted metal-dependent phosphoesterase TrpH
MRRSTTESAVPEAAAPPPPAVWRVDLHVHSRFSGDNEAEPEEVVERAIERGLDGIAFTEHYLFEASAFVTGLRERYRGRILLLRGVEYSSAEGHCLVFGVDTDRLDLGRAPLGEVVRAVDAAGGVVIPSHPYRGGSGAGDLIRRVPGICAVEGCNGVNMPPMNQRAIEVAEALGLPYTGGSDAHQARDVGACCTLFRDRVTEENLLALLKAGRYRGEDRRGKMSHSWIPGAR